MFKKYLKYISKFNSFIVSNKIKEHELVRIINSDLFWISNFRSSGYKGDISVGDIFYFEFGKNIYPEMSYEHRGLIIGKSNSLLYVLPIYSYHQSMDLIINSELVLKLSPTDHPFIEHDSVLSLHDLCPLSKARIKSVKIGEIDPSSEIYKYITERTMRNIFPALNYELNMFRSKS